MIPKRIESLKTMEELSVYACAKVRGSKDWATKCMDCNMCPVGAKAEELLEAETAPIEERLMTMTVEERCAEALKHENSAEWLVKYGYYKNNKSASAQIRKYKQNHGLSKRYSGSYGQYQTETARKEIEDLFNGVVSSDEAVDRYLRKQKQSNKISNLYSKAYKWIKIYPDLAEKYPIMKETAKSLSRIGQNNKTLTVAEYLKNLQNEDDEVSVEEFLEEAAPSVKPEEPPKPATDKIQNDPVQASSAQMVLRDEFSKKRRSIRERIEKLKEAKQLIDDEMAELQNKLNMLDQTAELFGMKAIKTIRCSA